MDRLLGGIVDTVDRLVAWSQVMVLFMRDTLGFREYGYGFRDHCTYQQCELYGSNILRCHDTGDFPKRDRFLLEDSFSGSIIG